MCEKFSKTRSREPTNFSFSTFDISSSSRIREVDYDKSRSDRLYSRKCYLYFFSYHFSTSRNRLLGFSQNLMGIDPILIYIVFISLLDFSEWTSRILAQSNGNRSNSKFYVGLVFFIFFEQIELVISNFSTNRSRIFDSSENTRNVDYRERENSRFSTSRSRSFLARSYQKLFWNTDVSLQDHSSNSAALCHNNPILNKNNFWHETISLQRNIAHNAHHWGIYTSLCEQCAIQMIVSDILV